MRVAMSRSLAAPSEASVWAASNAVSTASETAPKLCVLVESASSMAAVAVSTESPTCRTPWEDSASASRTPLVEEPVPESRVEEESMMDSAEKSRLE